MDTEDRLITLLHRLRRLGVENPPTDNFQASPAQIMLLEWIAAHPGCRAQDVAEGLGLTSPTVSVGLRRLEKMGLLHRVPHPSDKRALQIFLTAEGERLHQQIQALHRLKARQLLAGLTPDEQETLLTLWERALQAAEGNSSHAHSSQKP